MQQKHLHTNRSCCSVLTGRGRSTLSYSSFSCLLGLVFFDQPFPSLLRSSARLACLLCLLCGLDQKTDAKKQRLAAKYSQKNQDKKSKVENKFQSKSEKRSAKSANNSDGASRGVGDGPG